ncbi:RNA polymerase sigma factor [Leptospira sp. GIMC2001]|uniref:RNA polymerase sigma factor n=1 Tax=Leptospira sp. GIMC2001 TaxID=1513297 RepID=UPI00234A6401|nr:RNA polymerase sigma factor [Leptospira sp. GIMC2001]WCL49675.1 RNA polymerase sigma factor [Leptospira sp. GIMC2001]
MTNHEFEQVVSTTKWAVLSAIQRYLNTALVDSIDDVAQETYLRIYRYIDKHGLDEEKSKTLGNWAYTIAKNESIRFNQRYTREWEKEAKLKNQNPLPSEPSAENSILDEMEYQEILQSIPEHFRDVIRLTKEGKSGDEIAKFLNIAPGTVKSRLSRARKFIYEKFNNE